jgi:DNA-binding GntR family transcriptional regulator
MAASSTLAENVAAALRHAIFHGAYGQGERLIELSIAHEMQVSQNTVRDALRLLEQDGLVRKRARYGTHVRSYDADETAEIYALWAALEDLALHAILANIDQAGIARLQSLIDNFRGCLTQSQHWQVLDLRFAIHDRLIQIAQRPLTLELVQRLHNQARLLEATHPHNARPNQEQQLASYIALLGAISQQDSDRARQMLAQAIQAQRQNARSA